MRGREGERGEGRDGESERAGGTDDGTRAVVFIAFSSFKLK